jgi:hypothetical protein
MHDNNRINGYLKEGDLEEVSSEGNGNSFKFDNEPHKEAEGYIVHTLLPEQAMRLPAHEAAMIFAINQADIDRLKRSISQFGQQIPAVIYEGKVLDGRCRIRACVDLDLPVSAIRIADSDLNGLTPQQWVLHRNRSATDGRRISDGVYAMIVASVYGPKESEKALIRKKGGIPVEGEVRGEASEILGTTFNVSANLMKQALKVVKGGDANLIQLVKDKQVSLSRASELLKLPVVERKKVMNDPKAPLPMTSPDKALSEYKSAVKSLKKFYKRVNDISRSRHFDAQTRKTIEPTLALVRDAIAALE